jgi:hypothetical protein
MSATPPALTPTEGSVGVRAGGVALIRFFADPRPQACGRAGVRTGGACEGKA